MRHTACKGNRCLKVSICKELKVRALLFFWVWIVGHCKGAIIRQAFALTSFKFPTYYELVGTIFALQAVDWWLQLFHSGKLGSVMLDSLPSSPPGSACPQLEYNRRDTCVIYRNDVAEQLVNGHVMINPVQPQRAEPAPILRSRGLQHTNESDTSLRLDPHWVLLGERRYRCSSFDEAASDVLPMRMRPEVKEKWGYTRKLYGHKKQAWKAGERAGLVRLDVFMVHPDICIPVFIYVLRISACVRSV